MSEEISDDEIAAFLDRETLKRALGSSRLSAGIISAGNGVHITSQTEILWERVRATERRLSELESQMRWCVLCISLLSVGLITALTALATQ